MMGGTFVVAHFAIVTYLIRGQLICMDFSYVLVCPLYTVFTVLTFIPVMILFL